MNEKLYQTTFCILQKIVQDSRFDFGLRNLRFSKLNHSVYHRLELFNSLFRGFEPDPKRQKTAEAEVEADIN